MAQRFPATYEWWRRLYAKLNYRPGNERNGFVTETIVPCDLLFKRTKSHRCVRFAAAPKRTRIMFFVHNLRIPRPSRVLSPQIVSSSRTLSHSHVCYLHKESRRVFAFFLRTPRRSRARHLRRADLGTTRVTAAGGGDRPRLRAQASRSTRRCCSCSGDTERACVKCLAMSDGYLLMVKPPNPFDTRHRERLVVCVLPALRLPSFWGLLRLVASLCTLPGTSRTSRAGPSTTGRTRSLSTCCSCRSASA